MKSAYTILLILSFLGVAVFGFLAMNHESESGHSGCIAITAKGIDCPQSANPLFFAIFHSETLKSFSSATINHGHFNILILLAFIVLLLGRLYYFRIGSDFLPSAKTRHFRQDNYFLPLQQNLAEWLALHENSPTYLFKT